MTCEKHIIFAIILLFCTNNVFSQVPVVLWEQGYGNTNMGANFGSALKTTDGNFILVGSNGIGTSESIVVKITTDNQLVWENIQTNYYVKKGFVQQNDGFFYSVKNNLNNYILYQFNANGVLTNQWGFTNTTSLDIRKLITTQDGGFLLSGTKNNPEISTDLNTGWVVKLNASKTIEWELEIALPPDAIQLQTSTQITDGNFLVAGHKEYNDATSDFYLAKIDIQGNLVWEREYGGSESEDVWAVTELVNGNYILAGASNSNDGDVSNNNGFLNVWVIITDVNGNLLNEQIITDGFLSFTESSIIVESDGGYTIGVINDNCIPGSINFNLQRFNASHQRIWEFCSSEGGLYDLVKTDDDGYIAVGSGTINGVSQAKAIKIGVVLDNESFALQNTSFYPNPVKDILHIKSDIVFNHITIYTVDGRKVMREQIQNNQINIEKLPQNLYIAKLVSANEQEVNLKFVKN